MTLLPIDAAKLAAPSAALSVCFALIPYLNHSLRRRDCRSDGIRGAESGGTAMAVTKFEWKETANQVVC